MTDYLKWLAQHLVLECIQRDANGDLVRMPCAAPDALPRVYVARHYDQSQRYFRHDVPSTVREQLAQMSLSQLSTETAQVLTILDAAALIGSGEVWRGKSYVYLPETARQISADLAAQIQYQPQSDQCALYMDGQLATQCMSVRADAESAEAYVETYSDFRRRGLGQAVVLAWAQRVHQSGRIPFYSHHVDNLASQRLAQSAGLTWYMDDVSYE